MINEQEYALCESFLRKQKDMEALSDEEVYRIIEETYQAGLAQAKLYRGAEIEKLAEEFQVTLRVEKDGNMGKKKVRGQYDDSVRCITVYESSILEILLSGRLKLLGLEESYEAVRTMLLWHEFFHVLEARKIGLIGERYQVYRQKWLWKFRKKLYSVSEISAHAFTKEMMDLKILPLILDTDTVPVDICSIFQAEDRGVR